VTSDANAEQRLPKEEFSSRIGEAFGVRLSLLALLDSYCQVRGIAYIFSWTLALS